MVVNEPNRLNISLNSLTDSINASIISNTAGWTDMLPSGSLFVAHLRHAAKILSSGDNSWLSEGVSEGRRGRVSWLSWGAVREAAWRFEVRVGGSGGGREGAWGFVILI